MALVVKDRVRVVTTTTGTGTVTLGSAVAGFQSFSVIGDGNTTYYTIYDPGTGDWEVGVGTYTASGTTLSRTTVLESSNAGSLVNFGAGTKDVFVTYPAERSVYLDASGLSVATLDIGTAGIGTANITTANITAGTVSTTPTSGTDLANKTYVDTMVSSGITYHSPVKYEVPNTTGNLNATYNNGTAGVGATLTNNGTLAAFAPDGVTAQVGDRILVYNQTNAYENGVYTVTTVGSGSVAWVLTRATDANSYAVKSPTALGEGDAFFVTSGNTGAGETYVCNTVGTITFGTTAITFAQVSSAQIYSAGTGLTLSGTQFSITPVGTAGTYGSASSVPVFTTNASGQVSSVTNTAIAIAAGAVSGLAASATTDTTNAANITTGTLNTARLSGSYTGITGVGTLTAGTWNATAIGAAYGGTGQTTYAVGDILYADTATSLAKLADVVTGNALISGGVGTAPSWGKIGLQTHISGTLQVVNGGTGATDAATALTNLGAYPASNPNGYTSNTGTVTSVSGTGTVSGLSLSGTVTTSGSITLGGTLAVTPSNFASQTANTFLAAPNGTAGTPTFRAIVAADIPTLNQNTTGTASNVTGVVAIANGGTGQTSASAAFNALSPITTTGDLIIGNGTNSATRLPIGANNTVLTSNGTTASWQAASSGGATVSATPPVSPTSGDLWYNTDDGTLYTYYSNVWVDNSSYSNMLPSEISLEGGNAPGSLVTLILDNGSAAVSNYPLQSVFDNGLSGTVGYQNSVDGGVSTTPFDPLGSAIDCGVAA